MSGRAKLYIGAAGELRTGSELSLRGYLIHLPVMDEGGDIWVVVEDTGAATRVQVKTSASPNRTQWPGKVAHQVNIKGALLQASQSLTFVFHCIHDGVWHTFVMTRDELAAILPGKLPQPSGQKVVWFVFDGTGSVRLGSSKGPSMQYYADAWDDHFPLVQSTGVLP